MRGTDRGAAAAHRAGIGVEQLLPREVLDRRRAEAFEVRLHQVRHRPHGTLRSLTVLEVQVERAREHVAELGDRQDHEEHEERGNVEAPRRLVPPADVGRPVEHVRQGVTHVAELLEFGAVVQRDAGRFGEEPRDTDGEKGDEYDGVFGAVLDADAVRPLNVAANHRPDNAAGEDQAGCVAEG